MIKKIFQTTIAKIIVGIIAIITVHELFFGLLNYLLRLGQIPQVVRLLAIPIIITTLIIITYIVLCRYYERRKIPELSTHKIGRHLPVGLLLGGILMLLSVFVAYLRGEYTVLSINNLTGVFVRDLTISVFFGILTAVFEEILFRGVVFRLIEEKLGSYIALILSAVTCGLVHFMNENSSLSAIMAIIFAGAVLPAAYMYTRNLWFPIAIHFAWNFTQGDIFGVSVSGTDRPTSMIVSKLEGSEWFTGGAWGIEASVQTMIFALILTIILLVLSHKKKNIVKQQVFKMKME